MYYTFIIILFVSDLLDAKRKNKFLFSARTSDFIRTGICYGGGGGMMVTVDISGSFLQLCMLVVHEEVSYVQFRYMYLYMSHVSANMCKCHKRKSSLSI